jgi:hypothetical protein
MNWILILFLTVNPAVSNTGAGSASASVRVGFSSQETCVTAAKEVAAQLKSVNPAADVVWSCVKQ